jgi:hypothetical protein
MATLETDAMGHNSLLRRSKQRYYSITDGS